MANQGGGCSEAWCAQLTRIEKLAAPFRRDRTVRAKLAEARECLDVMMECDIRENKKGQHGGQEGRGSKQHGDRREGAQRRGLRDEGRGRQHREKKENKDSEAMGTQEQSKRLAKREDG